MLLALILVGAALLAVTLVLCFRFMLTATTRAIESRHRAMESILNTRRPPDAWTSRWRQRVDHALPARKFRLRERAKDDFLGRLDRLIAYARVARLIDCEETRSQLLAELGSVRETWDSAESASLLEDPSPEIEHD